MSAVYGIEIQQGIAAEFSLTWRTKSTRQPIDLTNWEISDCKVIASIESQAAIFSPTATILAPKTNGRISIGWTKENADLLKATGINEYRWYLDLHNTVTGQDKRLLVGPVIVSARGDA